MGCAKPLALIPRIQKEHPLRDIRAGALLLSGGLQGFFAEREAFQAKLRKPDVHALQNRRISVLFIGADGGEAVLPYGKPQDGNVRGLCDANFQEGLLSDREKQRVPSGKCPKKRKISKKMPGRS